MQINPIKYNNLNFKSNNTKIKLVQNKQQNTTLPQFNSKDNVIPITSNMLLGTYLPKANNVSFKGEANGDLYSEFNSYYKTKNFIEDTTTSVEKARNTANSMIKKHGVSNFTKWYTDLKGYYGDYEKFLTDFYYEAKSVDELLKYQPNWTPWKLEEKAWMEANPENKFYNSEITTNNFIARTKNLIAHPFEIGEKPSVFQRVEDYTSFINNLKRNNIQEADITISDKQCHVKRLKGGELNDKFVYLLQDEDKKYIVKFDRTNAEDYDNIDNREFSRYEQRTIRKNKYLSADSIYTNACLSRYLNLNGCNNIPELIYYNHETHSAIYEYIDDINGDAFQNDELDEEYVGIDEMLMDNQELAKYGIYLNDTALKNTLTDKNGNRKIIDLGHCSFISPFKVGVKRFNYEFANINGPDLQNIYAGILLSSENDL